MKGGDCSPLDQLERSFALLVAGPDPLAVDGGDLGGGLPARRIPLDELRGLLLDPSTGFAVRDAALGLLVRRARSEGPQWLVGLAGVLLPGLREMASRAAEGVRKDTAEVEAELLVGLLEALDGFDTEPGRIAGRLLWAAFRRAYRWRAGELEHQRRCVSGPPPGSAAAPGGRGGWGPESALVLRRAVAAGVVSRGEAELIEATRLGGASLPEMTRVLGAARNTLCLRRWRAERRLVTWLRMGGPLGGVGGRGVGPGGSGGRARRGSGGSAMAPRTRCLEGGDARAGARALPPDPHDRSARPRARSGGRALLSIAAAAALVGLGASGAAAAEPTGMKETLDGASELQRVIDGLQSLLVGLLAAIATLFLTIGGVRYIAAGGDPGELERAKTALRSAALGYGLAALAPVLLDVLRSVVGA